MYFCTKLACFLDKLAKDKHSSLLQKSVNYAQKSFITLIPRLDEHAVADSWWSLGRRTIGHLGLNPIFFFLRRRRRGWGVDRPM
jgi:hypothetical protein